MIVVFNPLDCRISLFDEYPNASIFVELKELD